MDNFILVTGGAGFIGSHTVKLLLKSGYKNIVVVDSLENGHRESVKTPNFHPLDLRNIVALEQLFKQYSFSHVMHFAAYASVPNSVKTPYKYYENNIGGGLTLLRVMQAHGVQKMVFSSSAAVYGEPQSEMINESDPKNPTNPYGQTKLMFELMLKDFHRGYGLNSISLRYFCAAGSDPDGEIGENHLPETHVIPLAIRAALDRSYTFQIYGTDYNTPDKTAIRDYIHVQDLAQAHILALRKLDNEPSYCEAFNLGIEKGFSVKEIIESVERVTGKKVTHQLAPRRLGDPTRLVARSQKAQDALQWKPQYMDIDDIVRTAYSYLKIRGLK